MSQFVEKFEWCRNVLRMVIGGIIREVEDDRPVEWLIEVSRHMDQRKLAKLSSQYNIIHHSRDLRNRVGIVVRVVFDRMERSYSVPHVGWESWSLVGVEDLISVVRWVRFPEMHLRWYMNNTYQEFLSPLVTYWSSVEKWIGRYLNSSCDTIEHFEELGVDSMSSMRIFHCTAMKNEIKLESCMFRESVPWVRHYPPLLLRKMVVEGVGNEREHRHWRWLYPVDEWRHSRTRWGRWRIAWVACSVNSSWEAIQ